MRWAEPFEGPDSCQADPVNDEWLLSAVDVAEALRCAVDDVVTFIDNGELVAVAVNPVLVTHDALRLFVAERQRSALQLGVHSGIAPDVLALRPGVDRFDDNF